MSVVGARLLPDATKAPHDSLCGATGCCDGNPEDDLKLPNGTVVKEVVDMMLFLQSWRVYTTDESEHMRRVGDNCTTGDCSTCLSMLRQRAFTPCHSKVGREPLQRNVELICQGNTSEQNHQVVEGRLGITLN